MSVVISYQTALGIINCHNRFRLMIMQNTTDIDFITGDQPVINIYSVRKKPHEKVRRLEFYHPLTPRIAMRLSCDQAVDEIKTIDSRSEIIKFNSMIRSESLEQIYSMRRNEIEPINQ